MNQFIKYPSINQFRNAIKWAQQYCKHNNIALPTVAFEGTVKLHGTNGSIVRTIAQSADDITVQSRERIITPADDNAGFAAWVESNKTTVNAIFDGIARRVRNHYNENTAIQIVGEWCGGNIQKKAGLSRLPKMFVIFAIRVVTDPEKNIWFTRPFVEEFVSPFVHETLHHIYEFPTWVIDVDFNKPHEAQNAFVDLVAQVEERCPVAAQLIGGLRSDGPLIGEGLVWAPIGQANASFVDLGELQFKTKGTKHSASKVTTIAAVDVERVETIEAFVANVVTENRLSQGVDKLRELGLTESTTSIGPFVKWVVGDVMKEESDTMEQSGLTSKEVASKVSTVARNWFVARLNTQAGL